ncbi:hypothetical protein [Microvirga sp. VF16]|uniref:hypothetical protein n=1 Tax=Microvirga sp. VF16 TaxID=2807101 RepID=UPI00193CE271|nr:hypothetical protein [Microvirga sp. VF16]QRM27779.1 hypothetical protein JO965_16095 [Microvirga sp. VF16]
MNVMFGSMAEPKKLKANAFAEGKKARDAEDLIKSADQEHHDLQQDHDGLQRLLRCLG